jgi:hypothetical protein
VSDGVGRLLDDLRAELAAEPRPGFESRVRAHVASLRRTRRVPQGAALAAVAITVLVGGAAAGWFQRTGLTDAGSARAHDADGRTAVVVPQVRAAASGSGLETDSDVTRPQGSRASRGRSAAASVAGPPAPAPLVLVPPDQARLLDAFLRQAAGRASALATVAEPAPIEITPVIVVPVEIPAIEVGPLPVGNGTSERNPR